MSSVLSRIAQVPTRTFVVTQDERTGERGPYYFLPETITAWIDAKIASGDLTAVGKVVTITGDFQATLDDLGSAARYELRRSLVDLGTEYVIGTETNSRMLVLRRVMGQGLTDDGGLGGIVAYVCTESCTSDLNSGNADDVDRGRFSVRVARV